jgi:hypothetical protein
MSFNNVSLFTKSQWKDMLLLLLLPQLIRHVLITNYFLYNSSSFDQGGRGVAMGTSLTLVTAIFYMESSEQVATSSVNEKPEHSHTYT